MLGNFTDRLKLDWHQKASKVAVVWPRFRYACLRLRDSHLSLQRNDHRIRGTRDCELKNST